MADKHLFLCWFNEHTKKFLYEQIRDENDIHRVAVKLQLEDKVPYNMAARTLEQQAEVLAKLLKSDSIQAYTRESPLFTDLWDQLKELRAPLDTGDKDTGDSNFQLYSGM